MKQKSLPPPDRKGIIRALPDDLSKANRNRLWKFGFFMFLYDFIENNIVRPRLHKADPLKHRTIIQKMLSPLKNARILDIGCGTGAAIPLIDESNDYTGVDLSYAMLVQALKKAKRHPLRNCSLIQANAETLPFKAASFDIVLMDTTLHMIPDCEKGVSEVSRVLRNGGLFLSATPAVGINTEFDLTWGKIAAKRNLHALNEDAVKRLCSGNALDYAHIATNGGMLYFHAEKKTGKPL
jgi:ubiquinone/menaquinone biosynthesis C-methylase UbiE